jgi:hypothetical protein
MHTVADSEMPQLFQAAGAASLEGQRLHVALTRWRLLLLSAAAVAGVASWRVGPGEVDVLAAIAVVLFTAALLVELWLWRVRPDKAWYDGRAVAESAKTLAWKFAVGGRPFPASMPVEEAKRTLLDRLDDVRRQFSELELLPVDAPPISRWMLDLRAAQFSSRKEQYIRARIQDQKNWYARKAKLNKRRAKQWRVATVCLELAGAIASLVEIVGDTGLLLAPALAAIAGAAVAWIGMKQHDALGRAYSAAVTDLVSAEGKLELVSKEVEWMTEVDDAEEAISREHTVWLASRSRV